MVLVAVSVDTGEILWSRHYPAGVTLDQPVNTMADQPTGITDQPGFVQSVPLDMVFSPDSQHLYVIGWTKLATSLLGEPTLAFAMKTHAASGETVWARAIGTYVDTPEGTQVPRDIAVSADGRRVYVTGDAANWPDCAPDCVAQTRPSRVPFAAALNAASGNIVWRADDTEVGSAFGWQLALSPDGAHLYQLQSVLHPDEWTKAIQLVAYDTDTGEQVWRSSRHGYPPPAGGVDENRQNPPAGFAISPDGKQIFVTTSHLYWHLPPGFDRPAVSAINFLALAWDATTGEKTWESEYAWAHQSGCTDGPDFATGSALSASGGKLYVVGSVTVDAERRGQKCHSSDPSARTVGLLALGTESGEPEWSTLYENAGYEVQAPMFVNNDSNNEMIILSDNLHVRGGTTASDEGSQIYLSASAAGFDNRWILGLGFDGITGQQVWQTQIDYSSVSGIVLPQGSELSRDGSRLFVTARPHSDVTTVAYPTAGTPPTVALSATPASGSAPLRVTLVAAEPRADAPKITRYRFDFGDGSEPVTQNGPATTHSYTGPGSYTATVTVATKTGAVATASASIGVLPT